MENLTHPFAPVFDENSRVLILGSFPSVMSRENRFYYGHPQNRFWRVIASVFGKDTPVTVGEKKELILSCRLALWDVIESCGIEGSADGSIRGARVNDLAVILNKCPIRSIYCNGKTAWRLYEKHLRARTGIGAACLPSTSAANARWTEEMLRDAWARIVREVRDAPSDEADGS